MVRLKKRIGLMSKILSLRNCSPVSAFQVPNFHISSKSFTSFSFRLRFSSNTHSNVSTHQCSSSSVRLVLF